MTDHELVNGEGGSITWTSNVYKSSIKKIYFGMNPQKVTAYKEALAYAEKEILKSLNFSKADNFQLVKSIIKTNALVTKYLNKYPGKLRNQMALLINDNLKVNRQNLLKILKQEGGSDQDENTFHCLYNKLEKYDLLDMR